ncbi:MAG: hypothetical protein HKN29_13310, partial [Rhodothermales bacterium]|nr:hypothetical protein [Rhodothermales bacterium]
MMIPSSRRLRVTFCALVLVGLLGPSVLSGQVVRLSQETKRLRVANATSADALQQSADALQ